MARSWPKGSSHLAKVLIASGLLSVTAAACGTSTPSTTSSASVAQPIQVSFWESHSSGGPPGEAVSALINEFNRTHKSIHINLTVTKASTKALAALAAGDAPVLALISHYDGAFLNAHALVSWNSLLLSGPQAMSASEQASFPASVWQNGEIGGQHYRIEADAKVSILCYNKAIFAQAGIAQAPTTWAELATDVALIKQKVPGVVPLAWKDSSAHILPPFLSNGGAIFLPGSHQTKTDFLSPAAVETFTYFRNLYAAGDMIIAHGTQIRADFASGHLAIADGTSAGYQKLLDAVGGKFAVGVMPYPSGSSGHTANLVQGLGFVLMVNNTAAQDQAAATFVDWWFAPAQQAYWGSHSGYPPETASGLAAISPVYLAAHPGVAISANILQSPYTISRPIPTAYKEVQAALDAEFYDAVTGKTTVQAALQALQSQADAYLSGNTSL